MMATRELELRIAALEAELRPRKGKAVRKRNQQRQNYHHQS